MRLAKPLVLLTGCVVVYGASFLNPKRDNPRWASAEASAANLSELNRVQFESGSSRWVG
jgi:hypothetical protein